MEKSSVLKRRSERQVSRAKKKQYLQRYLPKWEKDPTFKGWIEKSDKGPHYYYCNVCCKHNRVGKSEMIKHATSRKHLKFIKDSDANNSSHCMEFLSTELNDNQRGSFTTEADWDENFQFQSDIKNERLIRKPDMMQIDANISSFIKKYQLSSHAASDIICLLQSLSYHNRENSLDGNIYSSNENFPKLYEGHMRYSNSLPFREPPEDEFDSFGKSMADQMRKLPEEHSIELIFEIQNLITLKRRKVIEEKSENSSQPEVLTVSIPPEFFDNGES